MYLRSLISGLDVQDTIGIQFKDDFNLRDATRGRWDTGELEFAEKVVILRHSTFTLEHLDKDGRLVISSSGETGKVVSCEGDYQIGNTYIWLLRVGMTALRGMSLVKTPPVVSIPRVRELTSTKRRSPMDSSPERIPPWTAAPYATASSGLIPFEGSFPKKSLRSCWTLGIRVEPPTRTI